MRPKNADVSPAIVGANGGSRTHTGVNPPDPKSGRSILVGIKDPDLRAFIADYLKHQNTDKTALDGHLGYNPGDNHGYVSDNPVAVRLLLAKGVIALVDPEDYERIKNTRWRVKDGYVVTHVAGAKRGAPARGKAIQLHRLIMDATPGERIDHRDGNTLNNCRSNLRACSNAQNVRNSAKHRDKCTSAYKGVYRMKSGKFRAQIMCQYRKINLGTFEDEKAAALAYDFHAQKLFGEYARTNFRQRKSA